MLEEAKTSVEHPLGLCPTNLVDARTIFPPFRTDFLAFVLIDNPQNAQASSINSLVDESATIVSQLLFTDISY